MAAMMCSLDHGVPQSAGQPWRPHLSSMGAVEWFRANERGYIVLPMASLAGEGMDSSLAKVVVILESIWSGERDRREGLNGGESMDARCTLFANLLGIC